MSNLIGSFYFNRSASGNLNGEFINDQSEPFPESAILILSKAGFAGDYNCIWFDTTNHIATLEINPISGSKKYKLDWIENGKATYEGEGFLVNETLIGFYKTV
jgi:hypothetical protein